MAKKGAKSPSTKSKFIEVAVERRIDDDVKKARYNKYASDDETKEYMSKTERNSTKGINKTLSAKRQGSTGDWDVTEYDGPKSENPQARRSRKNLSGKDAFSDFPELKVDSLIATVGGDQKLGACDSGCAVGGKARRSKKGSRKGSKKGSRKGSKKKSRKGSKR